jgi:hypothetical protein
LIVQVDTQPVADLDVFMGNRWANMGSFMGRVCMNHLRTQHQYKKNTRLEYTSRVF